MGICSSSRKNGALRKAKIISLDGKLQEFKLPIKASHVLSQNPGCILCNSKSMYVDRHWLPVSKEKELQVGQIYFLMPISQPHKILSLQDLCALAIKAIIPSIYSYIEYIPTAMEYSEIPHFSHPEHKLKFEYAKSPFRCVGCKEIGIGSRYNCAACDYDLHLPCALPSPTISHPFCPKFSFEFLTKPPGDVRRLCDACKKHVKGFVYHCKAHDYYLHPCCATLPEVLDGGEVKLKLYKEKLMSSCHKCGRERKRKGKQPSWSYRSTCTTYNLHVACVWDMLVGSCHDIYDHGCAKTVRIPGLEVMLETDHQKRICKGKVIKKYCEIAGLVVRFIIVAVLGDPTTLIAEVIGSFMARS